MRRILLILLGSLLGGFGILFAYVAWDYDPDDVSPMVDAPSYQSIFEEAVQRDAKKAYATLDEATRKRALTTLASSKGNDPAREVALVRLRDLSDKNGALAVIKKNLEGLSDDQYDAAIGTILALGTPASRAALDSLYAKLDALPAAHTPIGDYRTSLLTVSRSTPDLKIDFYEQTRQSADYTIHGVREISLFFPSRPDELIEIPNVDDVLDDFKESRFIAKLDGTPVPADVWRLPLLKTLAALRGRLDETLGFMAPYFSPERFFKDNLMVGHYGEHYLMASFKDKNVSVAETLVDIFGKLGKDFGTSKWKVDGADATSIRNRRSGRRICYATVGSYFVTATDSALLSRALRTFITDHKSSIAIDPIVAQGLNSVDPEGNREVFVAWFNPTAWFDVIGSKDPSARRRAIVGRALGKAATDQASSQRAARLAAALPASLSRTVVSGEDPTALWRYIVSVRSLGKSYIDSLAKLAKMDIGKGITPWLAPSMAIGYNGVEHLKRDYSYSNTSFNLVVAIPLRPGTPSGFDSTLRQFLGRVTNLDYQLEVNSTIGGRLWIAHDTVTTDTFLLERKLQPSFGITNSTLVIATNPSLLRRSLLALASAPDAPSSPAYFFGSMAVDSVANNAHNYLMAYLLKSDRYTPDEIKQRITPMRDAISLYDSFSWSLAYEPNGLRRGSGILKARR